MVAQGVIGSDRQRITAIIDRHDIPEARIDWIVVNADRISVDGKFQPADPGRICRSCCKNRRFSQRVAAEQKSPVNSDLTDLRAGGVLLWCGRYSRYSFVFAAGRVDGGHRKEVGLTVCQTRDFRSRIRCGERRAHCLNRRKIALAFVNGILLYILRWLRFTPGRIDIPAMRFGSQARRMRQQRYPCNRRGAALVGVMVNRMNLEQIACGGSQAGFFITILGGCNYLTDRIVTKKYPISRQVAGSVGHRIPGKYQTVGI